MHRFKIYKINMCKYAQRGRCDRGESCTFAHDEEELRKRPDMRKTKLCRAWSQGKCHLGESCSYAHGREDLRHIGKPAICQLFREGRCVKGGDCKFAHNYSDIGTPLAADTRKTAHERGYCYSPRQASVTPRKMPHPRTKFSPSDSGPNKVATRTINMKEESRSSDSICSATPSTGYSLMPKSPVILAPPRISQTLSCGGLTPKISPETGVMTPVHFNPGGYGVPVHGRLVAVPANGHPEDPASGARAAPPHGAESTPVNQGQPFGLGRILYEEMPGSNVFLALQSMGDISSKSSMMPMEPFSPSYLSEPIVSGQGHPIDASCHMVTPSMTPREAMPPQQNAVSSPLGYGTPQQCIMFSGMGDPRLNACGAQLVPNTSNQIIVAARPQMLPAFTDYGTTVVHGQPREPLQSSSTYPSSYIVHPGTPSMSVCSQPTAVEHQMVGTPCAMSPGVGTSLINGQYYTTHYYSVFPPTPGVKYDESYGASAFAGSEIGLPPW
eukprot:GHVT01017056.1.p1 GENE.GHVT01017056.1~~GHVT01017056.1.p1  ORF type:complete len:497 (-),score=12.61 GHVT01017056.1:350-1840(-)